MVHTLCQREYSQVTSPNVGTGFAHARIVPALETSQVGTGFALARCVPMLGLWITFVGLVDNSALVCNLWIT